MQPAKPDINAMFQPDYTPEQLENLGVYDSLYRGQGPRLASLGEWKPEWISEHDPKGWAQWYKRYSGGRRLPEEDERQIKRWASFKARHGGPFTKNPTPRRGWALRNWGVDPSKLVAPDQSQATTEMLDEYQRKAMQKYVQEKMAAGWWPFGKQTPAAPTPTFKTLAPLKAQPAAPPKLPEVPPKQIGDYTFSGDAPATLGQHIGRWYTNTGGLNTAINSAQQAQQNRNPKILHENAWPKWQPSDVTQRTVPVRVGVDDPFASGTWSPADAAQGHQSALVQVRPQLGYQQDANGKWNEVPKTDAQGNFIPLQATLEHELSHNSYIRDKDTRDAQRAAQNNPTENTAPDYRPNLGPESLANDEGTRKYLLNPAETDVRLAEIKRRYAHHTGKLVETPAQAHEAWNWWRENSPRLHGESVELPGDPDINQKSTSFYDQGNKNPFGTGSTRPIREWWDKQHNREPVQNWEEERPTLGPDQFKLYDALPDNEKQQLFHRMPELVQQQNANAYKFGAAMAKEADLNADVQLQDHQQRISDRVTGDDPRMLIYHGLGSGKSLSALAAAEAAKKIHGGSYGIVVPASLRGNFHKEVKKFTRNSSPEIMSYTGLGMGKNFKEQPDTLIMDEAARLRNPNSAMTQAAMRQARDAQRLMLLTGTPITNSPTDLAPLVSMLQGKNIDPKSFGERYVGYEKVKPGWLGWLKGVKPGQRPYIKNEQELRDLLKGRVDYQPSKTPEGVNVNEEVIRTPLSKEQQKIQQAIRTTVPPGFLWKLDQEFPLSKDELARLNGFLTGMRQVGLSTQPFRADKNPLKAFDQSSKLTTAMQNLRKTLGEDPRKKALIYSNFVDAGINPYAAALERDKIPYGVFHGGISTNKRQQALQDYNAGKLRALLLGPAAAEGISTKGTSLIQLLDPHWNESRLQQAKGRGLRFDSHDGLPEELKNVAVQRYLNQSEEPGMARKYLFGKKRERTGDEVLERLTGEKEQFNEKFRNLLREIGTPKPEEKAARAFGQAMKRALDTTLPKPAVAPVPPPKDQSRGNETWTAPIAASFVSDAPTRGNALPLAPAGQATPLPNQNSGKPAQTASKPV